MKILDRKHALKKNSAILNSGVRINVRWGLKPQRKSRHRADDGVLNPFIHPLFSSEFNSEF
jgi:hypothetical protein